MREMEENHLDILLGQEKKEHTPFFLKRYCRMTYDSVEALIHLFAAGYQLNLQDLSNPSSLSRYKATITEALIKYPSWNNLTLWLHLASETLPKEQFLKQCGKFLRARASTIRAEIVDIVFHPSRIEKYVEMGYRMGDFHNIM